MVLFLPLNTEQAKTGEKTSCLFLSSRCGWGFRLLGTYEGREVQHDIARSLCTKGDGYTTSLADGRRTMLHRSPFSLSSVRRILSAVQSPICFYENKGQPMHRWHNWNAIHNRPRNCFDSGDYCTDSSNGEWTGSYIPRCPVEAPARRRGAGNDWLNSVARRGHQSGSDVNSRIASS